MSSDWRKRKFLRLTFIGSYNNFHKTHQEWWRDWPCETTATAPRFVRKARGYGCQIQPQKSFGEKMRGWIKPLFWICRCDEKMRFFCPLFRSTCIASGSSSRCLSPTQIDPWKNQKNILSGLNAANARVAIPLKPFTFANSALARLR